MIKTAGKRIIYGKTVGQVLPPIMKPICKKSGFSQAEIILDWNAIVGSSYSQVCSPIRVANHRGEACLYLSASKAVATQMFYEIPVIREKINRYFGFEIITHIKFMDAYPTSADRFKQKDAQQTHQHAAQSQSQRQYNVQINYSPLADALQRLFASIH